MSIFDTHCHYNLEPFENTWTEHWQKAQENGVTHSTVVSVDIPSSKKAIELANKNTSFLAVIGCHPGTYQEQIEKMIEHKTLSQIHDGALQLIKEDETQLDQLVGPAVKALGETGLDYFRLPDSPAADVIKDIQKAAFEMHIRLSQTHKLPLVIHVRDVAEDAYWDILELLKKNEYQQPFVLHCVSGPSQYVQEAIKLGAYIGLAGNVTYKNSEHIRELAAFAPVDKVLLETDAPFLPPIPFRGKTCEPWMIKHTADYVRDEIGLDLDQIYKNSFQLFGVK